MCVHFHIWLALWMMFYPIHFFGCARIPGTNVGLPSWQGIVPSKSIKMITIATNLILTRLVDIGEEFKKVNPAMVASLLEPLIDQDLTRLYPKIVSSRHPSLWESLPTAARRLPSDRHKMSTPAQLAIFSPKTPHLMDFLFDEASYPYIA